MKEEWRHSLLGEALTFQYGFRITKKKQRDGAYQVFSSSGPRSTHAEYRCKGPGVILGRRGRLGSVFFTNDNYWPHGTTFWVKNFHGNDPMFAYYFIQTMGFEKADVPFLKRDYIHSIPVRYPIPPTQRKIAAILSPYDYLIENNLRRIEILEKMVQTIYRQWFINFRFPGHQKAKVVDSSFGKIPEGWEISTVFEVSRIYRGRSYNRKHLVEEGGLPLVNIKCIKLDGGFRIDSLKRYIGPYNESQKVFGGDIVIAVKGMNQKRSVIAQVARVPRHIGKLGVISCDLVRIGPRSEYYSEYLYGMFRYSGFSADVIKEASGFNILSINPEIIMNHRFLNPTRELRVQYAQIVNDIYEKSDIIEKENINLRQTRDLLLPKLISGELDVSEIDINIP